MNAVQVFSLSDHPNIQKGFHPLGAIGHIHTVHGDRPVFVGDWIVENKVERSLSVYSDARFKMLFLPVMGKESLGYSHSDLEKISHLLQILEATSANLPQKVKAELAEVKSRLPSFGELFC